jgi:hypothetical protein
LFINRKNYFLENDDNLTTNKMRNKLSGSNINISKNDIFKHEEGFTNSKIKPENIIHKNEKEFLGFSKG